MTAPNKHESDAGQHEPLRGSLMMLPFRKFPLPPAFQVRFSRKWQKHPDALSPSTTQSCPYLHSSGPMTVALMRGKTKIVIVTTILGALIVCWPLYYFN